MVKKNIFSILVALLIMYLSLTSSHTFDKVTFIKIPFADKIVHFIMYFGLMSVIIFENRKILKSPGQLFLIALIPFFYGILMEILQVTLAPTRSGNFYDVILNLTGILFSLFLWLWIKPHVNVTIK
ncbi:MAG: VanZ family protein [Bacteroidia bacterium]|nr:VanZ family protein [Bacteroidia bacterium]